MKGTCIQKDNLLVHIHLSNNKHLKQQLYILKSGIHLPKTGAGSPTYITMHRYKWYLKNNGYCEELLIM